MDNLYELLPAENWLSTGDGFSLYSLPLADILNGMGIYDTGLSEANPQDVQSYYDDWYLYAVHPDAPVFSLLKMREQEHDYIPGFSDRDDPSVTVSFIEFPPAILTELADAENRTPELLRRFVDIFRHVTEFLRQNHCPALQEYFSDPASRGAYLIAECYIRKLISYSENGILPFPDLMRDVPERIVDGLNALNDAAGRRICDWQDRCLRIALPADPTLEEKQAILAVHTGNLSLNSFAAEVKFHADALVQWERHIPVVGTKMWYNSAIRADMQLERDSWIRGTFFSPYHHPHSELIREQERLHGIQ